MFPLETFNQLMGFATLGIQILTVGLILALVLRRSFPDLEDVLAPFRRWGLVLGFLVALVVSGTTLFYSDYLGLAACIMCWWQRICLYPTIVILGLAAWQKDVNATMSVIVLSVIGGAIALYQHLLQMGSVSAAPCNVIPGTDCAARSVFELGYITMPLMAFTVFAFLVVLMLIVRSRPRA